MRCEVFVFLYFGYLVSCVEYEDYGYVTWNGIRKPPNNSLTFEYYEGEAVYFTCHNTISPAIINISSNAFEMANISTEEKVVKDNDQAVFLYLRLSAQTNGKYLDCRVYNEYTKQKFVIRIELAHNTAKKPDLGFRVNDQYLPQIICANNSSLKNDLCYVYQYYKGEKLKIESFKNENLYKNLSCVSSKGLMNTAIPQTLVKFSMHVNFQDTNESVTCEFMSLLDNRKKKVELQFIPKETLYSHVIEGLSMDKTLGMYYRKNNMLSILYDYNHIYDTEELHFDCVSKELVPSWKSEDKIVEFNKTFTARTAIGKFKLKASEETGVITCQVPVGGNAKDYTEVILIRKRNETKQNASTEKTKETSTTTNVVTETPRAIDKPVSTESTTIRTEEDHKNGFAASDSDTDTGVGEVVLIGASIGALVAIVIIGLIIFKILKNKRKVPNPDSNINYESLPEHNKGAMPVPSQWREAQYTTPADRMANNSYAVPYKPTLEEMYTKPVPTQSKNGRANDNQAYVSTDELHPTYANVGPKELCNNNTNIIKKFKVLPTEIPLREIQCSENPYAEVNSSENPYEEIKHSENFAEAYHKRPRCYVNLFDGQRYVNTKEKVDDVEPAYCEMSNT